LVITSFGQFPSDCGVKSVLPTFFDRHLFLVSVMGVGTSRLTSSPRRGPLFSPPDFTLPNYSDDLPFRCFFFTSSCPGLVREEAITYCSKISGQASMNHNLIVWAIPRIKEHQ
jgi:hypothetical protein